MAALMKRRLWEGNVLGVTGVITKASGIPDGIVRRIRVNLLPIR
jgi:hypothetical protein